MGGQNFRSLFCRHLGPEPEFYLFLVKGYSSFLSGIERTNLLLLWMILLFNYLNNTIKHSFSFRQDAKCLMHINSFNLHNYMRYILLLPSVEVKKLALREVKWFAKVTQLTSGRATVCIQSASLPCLWHSMARRMKRESTLIIFNFSLTTFCVMSTTPLTNTSDYFGYTLGNNLRQMLWKHQRNWAF